MSRRQQIVQLFTAEELSAIYSALQAKAVGDRGAAYAIRDEPGHARVCEQLRRQAELADELALEFE